jgi:hypothetical protein
MTIRVIFPREGKALSILPILKLHMKCGFNYNTFSIKKKETEN